MYNAVDKHKITIAYSGPVAAFRTAWLGQLFDQYFEFVPLESAKIDRRTLVYVNFDNLNDNCVPDWAQALGAKIIVNNLYEIDSGPVESAHKIICDKWFWYNESAMYLDRGLNHYLPQRTPSYLALMPMFRKRPHRTDFLAELGDLVDKCIWSYVESGRQLPGDGDIALGDTQRYFNPAWYDNTYMSMVVETDVGANTVFITEKTFKPLAFQHPFIVYGNPHTLATLRTWGFETWDHLWDESYDAHPSKWTRLRKIVATLKEIEIDPYSFETVDRLKHNKELFFNKELVQAGIIKDIIEPLIEYAET